MGNYAHILWPLLVVLFSLLPHEFFLSLLRSLCITRKDSSRIQALDLLITCSSPAGLYGLRAEMPQEANTTPQIPPLL
jgi:hypothetical protein